MDWAQQIAVNNLGITPSELRDAMNFHTRSPGIANPLGTHEGLVVAQEEVQQTGFGGEGADTPGSGQYPESFRCIYNPDSGTYKIMNPIVCTPSGQINATGAENLSVGIYYCKVSNKSGTFSAEITDSSDTDENTVVIIPIANITKNDGIHQKHIGAIIVSNGVSVQGNAEGDTKKYGLKFKFESEDDSNVKVSTSIGEDGVVVIKFGVYYK